MQTFHDFIEELAIDTLGLDWVIKQQNPPHILIRHAKSYFLKKSNGSLTDIRKEEGGSFSAIPGNNDLYWLSFCYDLFVLVHKKVLPNELIKRLKNHQEFQGARYELAVAAIFLRAGFEIEWVDTDKQTGKSCEFIATHEATGIKVGVEAKSKKRKGAIHEEPGDASKRGISDLLRDAKKKKNDENAPLAIFIDVNLPFDFGPSLQKPIFNEVKKAIGTLPEDKDSFNLLVITNFPFYYDDCDKKISLPEHITVLPFNNSWLNPILRDDLEIGIKRYSFIPEEI